MTQLQQLSAVAFFHDQKIEEDFALRGEQRAKACLGQADAIHIAGENALQEAAGLMSFEEALAMRGSGWDSDLDELRDSRFD